MAHGGATRPARRRILLGAGAVLAVGGAGALTVATVGSQCAVTGAHTAAAHVLTRGRTHNPGGYWMGLSYGNTGSEVELHGTVL